MKITSRKLFEFVESGRRASMAEQDHAIVDLKPPRLLLAEKKKAAASLLAVPSCAAQTRPTAAPGCREHLTRSAWCFAIAITCTEVNGWKQLEEVLIMARKVLGGQENLARRLRVSLAGVSDRSNWRLHLPPTVG